MVYGMAGEGDGGQLSAAMRKMYFPDGNAPSPMFLAGRLAAFMTETRWPKVLTKEYADTVEYAYDLGSKREYLLPCVVDTARRAQRRESRHP